jgi:glycine dehydrogenase subunit 1
MRYLPLTDPDRRDMLAAIGAPSVESLFRDVPEAARFGGGFDLPDHKSELEVEQIIGALAKNNMAAGDVPSFLGAGAYRHHIPAAVDHLIQRGEYLTSYTPYQPEISQGTLQALFEFQTQVALITGMEVANASMYDGATSCAEAVLMARRITRRDKAILSGGLHPHYRDVTETQTRYLDLEIVSSASDLTGSEDLSALIDDDTACVVVQNPGFFGHLRDFSALAAQCQAKGALLIAVVPEVISLGAVMAPGDMGADIVVAEGQSLGNPLGFGGPYVGLFAAREKYVRQMPGRLCGETVDEDGRRGWVLTLSTREQHIRREKATSNICTNSGLCALAFTIHLALLGEAGFAKLAALNHARAVQLAERLSDIGGVEIVTDAFFNEFAVRLPRPAADVVSELAAQGILAGVPVSRLIPGEENLTDILLLAATECTGEDDIETLAAALGEVL